MVVVLTPPTVSSVKEVTETKPTVCGEKEIYIHRMERTRSKEYIQNVCLCAVCRCHMYLESLL